MSLSELKAWFREHGYEIMLLFVNGLNPSDKDILMEIRDNYQWIDLRTGKNACFIYFDINPSDIEPSDDCNSWIHWVRRKNPISSILYFNRLYDNLQTFNKEIIQAYRIPTYKLPALIVFDRYDEDIYPVEKYEDIESVIYVISILDSFLEDKRLIENKESDLKSQIDELPKSLEAEKKRLENKLDTVHREISNIKEHLSSLKTLTYGQYIQDLETLKSQIGIFISLVKEKGVQSPDFERLYEDPGSLDTVYNKLDLQQFEDVKETKEQLVKEICLFSTKYVCKAHTEPINTFEESIQESIQKLEKELEEKTSKGEGLKNQLSQIEEEYSWRLEKLQRKLSNIEEEIAEEINEAQISYATKLGKHFYQRPEEYYKKLDKLSKYNFARTAISLMESLKEKDIKFNRMLLELKEKIASRQFDIFISSKSQDYNEAQKVYDYLVSIGKRPFLAEPSLHELGVTEYGEVIREVIDICKHMIVICTNPSYVNTSYVYSEWNMFLNAKSSGRKTGNLITIISREVDIKSLNDSLSYCQSFYLDNYKDQFLSYIE